MKYQEAMDMIEQSNQFGSVLGLDNITRLLDLLGNPQNQCKVIHIAGTNGKGSILAYLDGIFREAGYLVGRYISPTIFEYRERFQINGKYISEEDFSGCMEQVAVAIEKMLEQGYEHPTVYEIETAISFLYFLEKQVDVVLLETGLGGRLDATNVVERPLCEVIASISMDHMQFLGDTIEKIAIEKAGIIKPHTSVVVSPNDDQVCQVMKQACKDKQATLHMVQPKYEILHWGLEGQSFTYDGQVYDIRMLGEHQVRNAITAINVCNAVKQIKVSRKHIVNGLKNTLWQGRFEVVSTDPVVIRDGAHNEDAANVLKRTLQQYLHDYRLIYIMGVFADKDYKKMVEITAPLADTIITITPDNPRGLQAKKLAEIAKEYCSKVIVGTDFEQAMLQAKAIEAQSSEKTAIVMFGSLSFIGKAEELAGGK
jgi:dihydrofolate synthase/folylpolyglutamate synthase